MNKLLKLLKLLLVDNTNIILLLLVILFIVLFVKKLNEKNDNLSEGFSNNKKKYVALLASWCGHCKTFKPILNSFKDNNPNIQVVVYEDDKEKNQEYNVEGFPTLILEHSDSTRINFTGPRTEKGLLDFYNKN